MNPATDLSKYAADVTSQWGEDGIIAEIFRRMGARSSLCIEFGAWDGKHLSNTWDLWHNRNWRAILIEGDPAKYRELAAGVGGFPQVIAYCAYVAATGENSLDAILKGLGIADQPDLLSIDVDGDDRLIFESLEHFLPRLLLIEYNPTIPPELDMAGKSGTRFGASALNLCRLAARKGYKLAACTITNLVFVQAGDFPALDIAEPVLAELMPRDHLTYVITDYSGTPYLTRQPTYAASMSSPTVGTLVSMLIGRQKAVTPPPADGLLPVTIFKAD